MALAKCPDCSAEVSANAPTCPKCGSPLKGAPQVTPPKKRGLLTTCCLGSVVLFVGFAILSVIVSAAHEANMTPEEKRARDERLAQAEKDRKERQAQADAARAQAAADAEAAKKPARVGEAIRDRYFEVTVNQVSAARQIGSNQFTTKEAGAGNVFLVMNITIKNVDTEARVFADGRLWVTHGGKELEFDASERVLGDEGWIVFENLNPLTTVTGNIAFKVPDPLPRPVYWQPGRGDKRILVVE